MTNDPNRDISESDAVVDRLLQQRELGGEFFVQRTLDAVRRDTALRRQTRRRRSFIYAASGLAAGLALMAGLWQTPAHDYTLQTVDGGLSPDEAALYGEMLALEDLLTDARTLAHEENQQTLDFLIFLALN